MGSYDLATALRRYISLVLRYGATTNNPRNILTMNLILVPSNPPPIDDKTWLYTRSQGCKMLHLQSPQRISQVLNAVTPKPADLVQQLYVVDCYVGSDNRPIPEYSASGRILKTVKGFTLYSLWFVHTASRIIRSNPRVNGKQFTYETLGALLYKDDSPLNYDSFMSKYPSFLDFITVNNNSILTVDSLDVSLDTLVNQVMD